MHLEKEVILQFIEAGSPCRIVRRIPEADVLEGIVLGLGDSWLLLCRISPAIALDGYSLIRPADVSTVESMENALTFVLPALEGRGSRPEQLPELSLKRADDPIRYLRTNFAESLVSLFEEEDAPHECHVGRILQGDDDTFEFREVTIHAEWRLESSEIEIESISRCDFGGSYEDALNRVLTSRS